MIEDVNKVINDTVSEKRKNSKGTTEKVTPANGSNLDHQRLEQKKVDDEKPKEEKSGKEKSRAFKKQYADKYKESKGAGKQEQSNARKPEYKTYGSNNLSYEIQQRTNPIRNKLFGKPKEKDLGEK